jgi:hypothetical protein
MQEDSTMRSLFRALTLLMFCFCSLSLAEAANVLVIPKSTLVRLRIEDDLSTRRNRRGDMVRLTVVDDVRIGSTKVVARGALAQAQLTQVRGPGRFGRNGSLRLTYLFVTSTRGQQIGIALGNRATKTNQSMGLAAGASAGGFLVLGPIGLVGGVFVRGHHIDIPKGTELMVEVAGDTIY